MHTSVYRIDVGITAGRRDRAVDVVRKARRSRSFAARDGNLVPQHGRAAVRLVPVRAVPRGRLEELGVVLDAAALQLDARKYTRPVVTPIFVKSSSS